MNDFQVYAHPEVRDVIRLHQSLFTSDFKQLSVREQLDRQAKRIVQAHIAGNEAVATHFTCWHPELVGHSVADIMGRELTITMPVKRSRGSMASTIGQTRQKKAWILPAKSSSKRLMPCWQGMSLACRRCWPNILRWSKSGRVSATVRRCCTMSAAMAWRLTGKLCR